MSGLPGQVLEIAGSELGHGWHLPCFLPIVARWFESLKIDDDSPAERQLMREVNHATGNLVHRMFYWAELLGETPPPGDAQEAVENLKTSLGELHRLVTRSLDLVREVEVRAIGVSVSELVASIALRFGTEADWSDCPALEQELAGREALIDPVVVDRGVGLLAEALLHVGRVTGTDAVAACDVSPFRVRRAEPAGDPTERDGVFVHCVIRARATGDEGGKGAEQVDDAVAFALAKKLLAALGWLLEVEDVADERRLAIFVPVRCAGDATTGLSVG